MAEEIAPYVELTAEQNAILEALKMGNTRTASWQYAGVSHQTFYRWLHENVKFCEAVTRAEATAEVGHVGVLAQAAIGGDWRASLEWLRRRRRVEWGDSVRTEVTGKDGGPIQVKHDIDDLRKLSPDELIRLYRDEVAASGEVPK